MVARNVVSAFVLFALSAWPFVLPLWPSSPGCYDNDTAPMSAVRLQNTLPERELLPVSSVFGARDRWAEDSDSLCLSIF